MVIDIVRKPPEQRGFEVHRKRWIVERTLAWLTAHRRLARDYERDPEVSEELIRWAAINQMLRRVARGKPAERQQRRTALQARPDIPPKHSLSERPAELKRAAHEARSHGAGIRYRVLVDLLYTRHVSHAVDREPFDPVRVGRRGDPGGLHLHGENVLQR